MRTFRITGLLLLYPEPELIASLPAMRQELEREALMPVAPLVPLFERLGSGDLLDLQEDYVGLFDRNPSQSLHLYEHVWGDARERGQAMVRLQAVYRLHGVHHASSELPDYLPLFCEFLSLVPLPVARSMLSEAAAVLDLLRRRLERRGTPYAAVCAGLVGLAAKAPAPDLLAQLAQSRPAGDDDSFAALDRSWEEAAVTFGPQAADCGTAPRPHPRPSRPSL